MKQLFLLSSATLIGFSIANAQVSTPPPAAVMKTRIIKTDFFAPLTGNVTFGYEQWLADNFAGQIDIGIIGVGADLWNVNASGVFFRLSPKLYFNPDWMVDGMYRTNPMQGFFVKGDIVYSHFDFDDNLYNIFSGSSSTVRVTDNTFAVMISLGIQKILANRVSIDLYAGGGYGYSDAAPHFPAGFIPNPDDQYGRVGKFSHIQFPNEFPLALEMGMNIGLLLR